MYLNWKDTVWVKLHCRKLLFFSWKHPENTTMRKSLFFFLSRLFSIYYFNIHGLSLRRLLIGCKFQLSMEQEAAGACVRAACSSLFSQEGALFIHLRAARRSTAPSLRLSLALRLKLCVLRPVFVSSSRLAGGFSPSLSVQTSCCHYPPPIPCQTSIEFASKPCNTITVFDRKTCHLISTCWSTQVTAAVFKPSPNASWISQATRIPLHLLSTQRGAVITVQLNKFNNVSPLCIHSDSSRSKCQRWYIYWISVSLSKVCFSHRSECEVASSWRWVHAGTKGWPVVQEHSPGCSPQFELGWVDSAYSLLRCTPERDRQNGPL